MANKSFSKKKYLLRSRAEKRRQSLKIDAPTFGVKFTPEMKNLEVIRELEAKIKAIQAA